MRAPVHVSVFAWTLGVGLLGSGCSLFDSDFDGQLTVRVQIQDPDRDYESDDDRFNPNDDEDYRENRDRVKDVVIDSLLFTLTDVPNSNIAEVIAGQVDVVNEATGSIVPGVSAWEGVQVVQGNQYFVSVPSTRQEELSELVLGVDPGSEGLLLIVKGEANASPVDLQMDVTLNFFFTAGI